MPEALRQATIDHRVKKIIDEDTWAERIALRANYLVKNKGKPLANGDQRVMCPATGPSPSVVCPLRKLSFEATKAHLHPHTVPPKSPSKLCSQGSISIPAVVGAKYRQDVRFGTPEWGAAYPKYRNTIEGFNGFIKDGGFEALGDASRRRFRGRTAQHLMAGLLVVAANLRKIRAWVESQPTPIPEPKRASPKGRRSKRRDIPTLDEYRPEPNAPPGLTGTEN